MAKQSVWKAGKGVKGEVEQHKEEGCRLKSL